MALTTTTAFGRHLKTWRRRRGVSQLDLAVRADLSQRHVSFIETGRSRPGESTVHRIAEALEIPLRERNTLLEAAGLPPLYPELPLGAAASAPFQNAIARILASHEPYPAFVIDRWWDVVDGNRAARRFFPALSAPGGAPVNFIETFFAEGPLQDLVVNYPAVAWAALRRLRAEVAHLGGDAKMDQLLTFAEQKLSKIPDPGDDLGGGELVVCPHLRWGNRVVKTISLVARFGNTREVTLDELRVELMLPQDENAEAFFRQLALA